MTIIDDPLLVKLETLVFKDYLLLHADLTWRPTLPCCYSHTQCNFLLVLSSSFQSQGSHSSIQPSSN